MIFSTFKVYDIFSKYFFHWQVFKIPQNIINFYSTFLFSLCILSLILTSNSDFTLSTQYANGTSIYSLMINFLLYIYNRRPWVFHLFDLPINIFKQNEYYKMSPGFQWRHISVFGKPQYRKYFLSTCYFIIFHVTSEMTSVCPYKVKFYGISIQKKKMNFYLLFL